MAFLFWAAIILVACIALVLATPVWFELSARRTRSQRFLVVARPFAGYGPRITLVDNRKPRQKKSVSERKVPKARKRRFSPGANPRIVPAGIALMRGLLACVRFESLELKCRFGTGDPAETGQIYGMLAPLIYGSPAMPGTSVSVSPDFVRACAEGDLTVRARVVPAALVPPVVRFGWAAFGPVR